MKVLTTTLIQSHKIKKSVIRVKICHKGSLIPCLPFVNDSIPFCKVKTQSFGKLPKIIDAFCAFSGQFINSHKSSMIFSANIGNNDIASIILHVLIIETMGKYLGCPFIYGRMKIPHSSHLFEKANQNVNLGKLILYQKLVDLF